MTLTLYADQYKMSG